MLRSAENALTGLIGPISKSLCNDVYVAVYISYYKFINFVASRLCVGSFLFTRAFIFPLEFSALLAVSVASI